MAIIPWLKENYGVCEVVAFVADIGQERSDLEDVEQKAFQSGASECHVVDLREEFISNYFIQYCKLVLCMKELICWVLQWHDRLLQKLRLSWL